MARDAAGKAGLPAANLVPARWEDPALGGPSRPPHEDAPLRRQPRFGLPPIPRTIAGGEPAERERIGGRRVDAGRRRAGRPIAGFRDQLADDRVPIAVRIAEMRDRPTEQIFQFLPAGGDFLAGLLARQRGEPGMLERVRADVMSGGE